ncbi:MAG: hypothetical protein AAGD32_06130 [Planctomycetota bacterium]
MPSTERKIPFGGTVFVVVAAGVIFGALGFWRGDKVPGDTIRSLFGGLVTIAGFVLAVAGIWFAVLYPAALASLANRSGDDDRQVRRVGLLILPVLVSVATVIVAMVGEPLHALLETFTAVAAHDELVRRIAFSVLVFLTTVEAAALVVAVSAILSIHGKAKTLQRKNRHVEAVTGQPAKPVSGHGPESTLLADVAI